ncbi:MAG: hypothetical protein RL662_620 [Bacteroidota bacterium]|jgi:hypothetical protein
MFTPIYKILYHFDNAAISILEIKRAGVGNDNKEEMYHWVCYDKKNDLIFRLNFRSMNAVGDKEFREFQEGKLEFTDKTAVYSEKGNTQLLKNGSQNITLDAKVKEAVEDYLVMVNMNKSF